MSGEGEHDKRVTDIACIVYAVDLTPIKPIATQRGCHSLTLEDFVSKNRISYCREVDQQGFAGLSKFGYDLLGVVAGAVVSVNS